MKQRRRRLLCLVLLLGVLLLPLNPDVGWCTGMVWLKLRGRLPEVPWSRMPRLVAPRWIPGLDGALGVGFVTLEQTEPGPCDALWQTPVGSLRGRLGDERLLERLFRERLVDRIYDHPEAGVRPGDVVLDVGGHLGTFTRFALLNGAAHVVVFEPEPVNATCLSRSLEQEIAAGRVSLVVAAAADQPGTLSFRAAPEANTGTARIDDSHGELTVEAVTIDATCARLGLDSVDFIKMDIEGGERYALAGATETIARFQPRMALSIYHLDDDPEVIRNLVTAAHPEYCIDTSPTQAFFYSE